MKFSNSKIQGVGIGLRSEHYADILDSQPNVPWFEAISENYIGLRAWPLRHLEQIRQNYPIALHGVSLSIGSTDPINWEYLQQLKDLSNRIESSWISDHLCWTSFHGQYVPDLLPLPFNQETIDHIVNRIHQVQDFLGQQILLENISSYLKFKEGELSEWDFISKVCQEADCYILLDINNIYVNSQNHNFDPLDFIKGIPKERVKQFHLGGFEDQTTHLLDTHGAEIQPQVWPLYSEALQRFGSIPTLIEWDTQIPPFSMLLQQAQQAEAYMRGAF